MKRRAANFDKRRRYALILLIAVTCGFLLFEFNPLRNRYPRTSTTHVCIIQSRDDLLPIDKEILNAKNLEELRQILNKDLKTKIDWSRYVTAANKAYSLKHHYTYHVFNTEDYKKIATKRYRNRNRSWWKLLMIKDVQQKEPKCEWIMHLDMKTYFYMDNHQTSLDHWISTSSIVETSKNYDYFNTIRRMRKGYYSWNDQDSYFIVPLAGVYQDPPFGRPGLVGDPNSDYAKSTYFIVKNNVIGRNLVEEWVNGPNKPEPAVLEAFQSFANASNCEEGILTRVVLPIHFSGTNFMSYRTFGLPDGLLMRSIHGDPADDLHWKELVISLGLIRSE